MQIEDLTKIQIILLTLLVSFVTSIATGIVTVSLLDQAPKPVTQTINRVVERTIEKISPASSGNAAAVTMKETTVVVKEEDAVTDAIARNEPNIVRIYGVRGTSTAVFMGVGVLVREDGLVVADASAFRSLGTPDAYRILVRGTTTDAVLASVDGEASIALFTLPLDENLSVPPLSYTDPRSFRLGQTVLALGGEHETAVAVGIIAGLETSRETSFGEGAEKEDHKGVMSLSTTVASKGIVPGTPFFNLFGELVGIAAANGSVTPAHRVVGAIAAFDAAYQVAPPDTRPLR